MKGEKIESHSGSEYKSVSTQKELWVLAREALSSQSGDVRFLGEKLFHILQGWERGDDSNPYHKAYDLEREIRRLMETDIQRIETCNVYSSVSRKFPTSLDELLITPSIQPEELNAYEEQLKRVGTELKKGTVIRSELISGIIEVKLILLETRSQREQRYVIWKIQRHGLMRGSKKQQGYAHQVYEIDANDLVGDKWLNDDKRVYRVITGLQNHPLL